MNDDIINQEKTYWSKEIANSLEIQPVTLRKWCKLLEDRGYHFLKDEHDRRAFTEHDAIALRKFKKLTKDKVMSQDSASEVIVAKYNRDNQQVVAPTATAISMRSEQRYAELLETMEEVSKTVGELLGTMEEVSKTVGELREENQEQRAFNNALLERLDRQQEYIERSIKARDEQLMTVIREMQERRQLELAAAQEEQEKKGFWRRLFGK